MGCNAIRTSHNPPAPELLELCDRLGMLVMDEAFDCWRQGKRPNDYHLLFDDWAEKDLRALVRRDRNHPSVILWSIGNEVGEQHDTEGWRLAAHLAGIVREEDRTRPVTAGCDDIDSGYNGFQTALDVLGYNYKPDEYKTFHSRHPAIPVFGSETASCVSSRGEYFFPVSSDKAGGRANFQVSSYDLYAPQWAWPPDVEFKGLDEAPFAAGEFVWTGFDYLGEPTPYNADSTSPLIFTDPAEGARTAQELKTLGRITVPSRSSYFGILDLAGFKKDRFFLYQARWRPDYAMAHILPHWNWPDRAGQVTPVFVYTSGDEAELFLNGRSLGRKKMEPRQYRLRWDDVKYQPGELKVVAYKRGQKWAEDVVKTTGAPARIALAADRAALKADGTDLAFVTVTIADADGLLVPQARNLVKFELGGPGEIAAVDNGDATGLESFQAQERHAYDGLALVVVRTKAGEPGVITLKAQSDGLAAAEVSLRSTTTP
jgi:beta-galactosidase